MVSVKDMAVLAVSAAGLWGIAAGRLPFLKMDRTGIALFTAVVLVLIGALAPAQALASIDLDTIALLFGMMVLTAWLEISGLLSLSSSAVLRAARGGPSLLAIVMATSGILSALFINDTMCLVLTPLVAALCLSARRDPLPYLVGLAVSSNIGSMPSLVGNPQNMLIGSLSGLSFSSCMLRLLPPALFSLLIAWIVIILAWPREFSGSKPPLPAPPRASANRGLALKTLVGSAALVILLVMGVRPSLAALSTAAFLMASRRVAVRESLERVDFGLLLFFSCLFVITASIGQTGPFRDLSAGLGPNVMKNAWALTGVSAALSNIVSNVPAVMLLAPLAAGCGQKPWLVMAMSSTFAGNLTLLGSVANLIVAEGAQRRGIKVGFLQYLKAGLPITVLSLFVGALWLSML